MRYKVAIPKAREKTPDRALELAEELFFLFLVDLPDRLSNESRRNLGAYLRIIHVLDKHKAEKLSEKCRVPIDFVGE